MTEQLSIVAVDEVENTVRCTCCSCTIPESESETHEALANEPHCSACYRDAETTTTYQCENCNRYTEVSHHPDSDADFPFDSGYSMTDSGTILCENCHAYCDGCNTTVHIDDYYGDGMCHACHREDSEDTLESCRDADSHTIYDYSTKPDSLRFYYCKGNSVDYGYNSLADNQKRTFLGIELEMCFEHSQWCEIANSAFRLIGGKYLWKHDGSIGQGAELVTEPATLEAHRSFKWRELLALFGTHGARSHDTGVCGLHVHINRTAFIARHDYESKLQKFFQANKHKLVKFSKRKDMTYCEIGDAAYIDLKRAVVLKSKDYARYVAVNLNPSNTVEIRLFRGTLNYPRFLASLQFCDALVSFVNSHSLLSCSNENSWAYFKEHCKQSNQYSHLLKYFKSQGL